VVRLTDSAPADSDTKGGLVPFLDLRRRTTAMRPALDEALGRVLGSGRFVLGPELESLEDEFAAFTGFRHAVGVSSGSDALSLALRALDVGAGDEVVIPAFTAVPTAAAVCATGATPVLADVDPETGALDPEQAAACVSARTRAIVPVHLYGRPVTFPDLGVPIVEDAAHAHGLRRVESRTSAAAAYSFYPTKNLGAIGDGGMVVTDEPRISQRVAQMRNHGAGAGAGYRHEEVAMNSRMSELEAASVRVGLRGLEASNIRRRAIAAAYRDAAPALGWHADHPDHVYHLCVLRTSDRDAFRVGLPFETRMHYPLALTEQPAYRQFARRGCPNAEAWAASCVSLPCFPEMIDDEVEIVCRALS
jgi:dTDP-3-amino-3,4,6-trideoxy-alpha-D-glucose transaminase